jgi:hypothetical protein
VSDEPIQLSIYSPNVPDLSLIDLPGYIQVTGRNQPLELKQKIADLCDRYIQPPNVILAISAADVDLANSTALRASKRVDPRGERTIGVITKLDLVDPERAVDILTDQRYPLRLGYVGVVCRAPPPPPLTHGPGGLFAKVGVGGGGNNSNRNIASAVTKHEQAYFAAHPAAFGPASPVTVGVPTLRAKLMRTLEQTMAASLQGTSEAVRQELDEAVYEFKVQYNDRPLSAESYMAECLDAFKHAYKEFTERFGRPQLRELLKRELDQRVLDLLAQRYWNRPPPPLPTDDNNNNDKNNSYYNNNPALLPDAATAAAAAVADPDPLSALPRADPDSPHWRRKLDGATASLTKLGIGRLATTVVAGALQAHVERLVAESRFAHHPLARRAILDAAAGILADRFYGTSDQVENCIKPYKYEIELEHDDDGGGGGGKAGGGGGTGNGGGVSREWARGRDSARRLLREELRACEAAAGDIEAQVGGRRRLAEVMHFVDRVRKGEAVVEGDGRGGAGGFSAALLQKGNNFLSSPIYLFFFFFFFPTSSPLPSFFFQRKKVDSASLKILFLRDGVRQD